MKLHEFTLRPLSGFSAPIKGDTLFGLFCWQVVHDPALLKGREEHWFNHYPIKPFAVFSSAFPKLADPIQYALKKPDMPDFMLFKSVTGSCDERQEKAKALKQKRWWPVEVNSTTGPLKVGRCGPDDLLTDQALLERAAQHAPSAIRHARQLAGERFLKTLIQPHNTISRLTDMTGADPFAPYAHRNLFYYPETVLAVFVWFDPDAADSTLIRKGLARIGQWGYGRDASTGMGRFEVVSDAPASMPSADQADALYTLAPAAPEKDSFSQAWFTPFIRFGKHGDRLALSQNPFKTPVIMADEGAVFKPTDRSALNKGYFGRAVTGVSTHAGTLVQGYAPVLPIKLEGNHEN